jgi:hypothetical protein
MHADQQEDQSKHGRDAADKPDGGAKQADNPRPEDIASQDERKGLGGRTRAQGGAAPTEPRDGHRAAETRK